MISAQGVAVVLEARGAARDRESWVGRRVVAVCSAAGTEFGLDTVALLRDGENVVGAAEVVGEADAAIGVVERIALPFIKCAVEPAASMVVAVRFSVRGVPQKPRRPRDARPTGGDGPRVAAIHRVRWRSWKRRQGLVAVHTNEMHESTRDCAGDGLGLLVAPRHPDIVAGWTGIVVRVPTGLGTAFYLEDVDDLAVRQFDAVERAALVRRRAGGQAAPVGRRDFVCIRELEAE